LLERLRPHGSASIASIDEVKAALEFIKADDREVWLKVGMAFHHGFGGSTPGYELWTEWSRQSDKFDPAVQLDTWKWFSPKGNAAGAITIASLFELAIRAGFKPNGASSGRTDDCWAHATRALDFMEQAESVDPYIIERLLAPGSLTIVSGTRGIGKSILGLAIGIQCAEGGEFLGQRLRPHKVLLLNRDNPPRVLRQRLARLGGAKSANLEILNRSKAPPLTDKKAWQRFPAAKWEVIIIDSLSAFIEGVDEKEGGATGSAIASLLDTAEKSGVAILVLANTTRTGMAYRGSGVSADRADIMYEARDATDLELVADFEHWSECLPDPSDAAWSARAKRRAARADYRVALNCTKFRDGDEPDPLLLEIRHDADPWCFRDVTAEVEVRHELLKQKADAGRKQKFELAVAALKAKLPCPKNPDAVDVLLQHGLGRNAARRLLANHVGKDWTISGSGRKGDPVVLQAPTA
jgi:hypothetical protein